MAVVERVIAANPGAEGWSVAAGRYAAMGGLRTTALDYAAFLSEVLEPRTAPPFRQARLAGCARDWW